MAKFTEGLNPQAKILISHCMPYKELDKRLIDYFCRARNLGYIIMGPGLIAEANQYSMEMGLDGFQASTGWLDSFKRHTTTQPQVCYTQQGKCQCSCSHH